MMNKWIQPFSPKFCQGVASSFGDFLEVMRPCTEKLRSNTGVSLHLSTFDDLEPGHSHNATIVRCLLSTRILGLESSARA